MNYIRSFARRGLRRLRLSRIHHPSITDFLVHEGIGTVFDVGANAGGYGLEIREQGYRGRIVSFEPIPEVYQKLVANCRSDPLWQSHQIGLGKDDQEMEISVTTATVFSSLKAPTDYTVRKFVGATAERRETIKVARLDTFLRASTELIGRGYLKIDTQGFEKEVLIGAGDCLGSFHAVQLEVALQPLYENQQTWIPMIQFMSQKGFDVAMAKENGFDFDAMRLLEMDVVFIRRA